MGLSGHPQSQTEVSRDLDIWAQSYCVQNCFLSYSCSPHQGFSSLTPQAETEKVSFQPHMHEWQAWVNNAVKFWSCSMHFLTADIFSVELQFNVIRLWGFTDLLLQNIDSHPIVACHQKPKCCILVNLPPTTSNNRAKNGSCIFNKQSFVMYTSSRVTKSSSRC